ncbi:MAG: glycine-rich protein, partial [Acutalibacteraceae bacterium]
ESYQDDVLVVAGGGGGSGYYQNTNAKQWSHHGLGGAGGGLESQGNHDNGAVSHGISTVKGSTQTASGTGTNRSSVGSFGQGASYDTREPYGSGGGGGWYGGSSTELQGGAGGSGHIGTGTINGETIAGTETFLAPDGTDETGHTGNGYARITYLPYIDFNYTGDVQTFTAPVSGYYQLETWGAQGGGSKTYKNYDDYNSSSRPGLSDEFSFMDVEGGRGGYSTATVYLEKDQTVYIAVGGQGNEHKYFAYQANDNMVEYGNSYNGGGIGIKDHDNGDSYHGDGGGATHIALKQHGDGQLYNYENYQNEVLVVAGGGGSSTFYVDKTSLQYWNHGAGGAGGGVESLGNHDNYSGASGRYDITVSGSTQTASGTLISTTNRQNPYKSGSFGQGASYSWSAGGGGWYGGAATYVQGGAGGSGHIKEGLTGETIAGTETFLSPSGIQETGHTGNGYARIILVGKSS